MPIRHNGGPATRSEGSRWSSAQVKWSKQTKHQERSQQLLILLPMARTKPDRGRLLLGLGGDAAGTPRSRRARPGGRACPGPPGGGSSHQHHHPVDAWAAGVRGPPARRELEWARRELGRKRGGRAHWGEDSSGPAEQSAPYLLPLLPSPFFPSSRCESIF